ncbi:MAG: ThuA domain-containing protein [Chlorobia bacterium]|nr:ThuA domain-containing protein [Fimbriimonadaceae bacterium]
MTVAALLVLLAVASPVQGTYEPGATLRLYEVGQGMQEVPQLITGQTPNIDRLIPKIDLGNGEFFGFTQHFYVEVTAQINVPTAGEYVFRLSSDDGSMLFIDGKLVVDNDGVHAAAPKEKTVTLQQGWKNLSIQYFEHEGDEVLKLEWKQPGSEEFKVVDASVLRVPAGLTRVVSPGTKRVRIFGGPQRPGNGMPLDRAHPSFEVQTVRPADWKPQVGALAFRKDGKLLVGTFKPNQTGKFEPELRDGEVWLLDGVLTGDSKRVTRKLIASGLQEPLGMTAIGEDVYVATRTAILQLVDKNGDDVIDEQRVVGNGWVTDNYHHFTFGLAQRNGWLYAALSTSITFDAPGINGPNPLHRGSAFRVNPKAYDPKNPLANIEFFTSGHRTPNGFSEGPDGLILTGENQGSWQPSNKVNILVPGGFYGHFNNSTFKTGQYPNGGVPGVLDSAPFTLPAIYLPQGEIGNSPGQMATIRTGEFKGQILITDVKFGGLQRGWMEQVDGVWQGGAVMFSQGFEVGTNRLIYAPDGSLIMGGTGATETWAWTDPVTKQWTTFGLQRLKPTGKDAFEIAKVSATPTGFRVHFTRPVPVTQLKDATKFAVKQWRYEPTIEYGGNKIDRETLDVKALRPAADGKSVEVDVAGLKEAHVVHLNLNLKSAANEDLWAAEAWYTLNRIPKPHLPEMSSLANPTPNLLVFSRTTGFRHSSIGKGIKTIQEIAKERGWKVTATEDAKAFTSENLAKFDAVVFLCTTGDVLDPFQEAAFEGFIHAGGGYVGVHSATDTEYGWPWFGKLAGAYFASHPQIQAAQVVTEDRAHPSTSFLPAPWMRVDEWYDFKENPRANVRVLASLKPDSYQNGKMADHPIVWCQEFEGGRSWYTGLGHTEGTYDELLFRSHLAEGILWAANKEPVSGSVAMPLSRWKHEGDWREVGGAMETPTGNNGRLNLVSREELGDCQLHVEFRVPKNGNSGVYLMGRYEIQILDSYGVANKDLLSSMCGSVYERWKDGKGYEGKPPMVNAARPPGEWQSFDIVFRAPRFVNGKKVQNAAFLEVRLNGVVVQHRVEITGPTRASMAEDEKPLAPIMLQGDHGPIAFRNIRVKKLALK